MAESHAISRDFRVIDADWPRLQAHEAVKRCASRYVVVRRAQGGDGARRYHVFLREEALLRLATAVAPGTAEALDLGATAPAPLIVWITLTGLNEAAEPSDVPQIVLNRHGLLGIVPAVARKRSAVRRSRGAVARSERIETAGNADPAAVTREVVAYLPDTVAQGATVSMLVSLRGTASIAAGAAFVSPVGTRVDIVVQPLKGLSLAGPGEGVLEVQNPQPETPLLFRLTATEAGPGSVRIHAFCSGSAVATLEIATFVASGQLAVKQEGAPKITRVSVAQRVPPDLSMYIFESGNELSFSLQSADGRLQMKKYAPVQFRTSPREHFRTFFRDIEKLPLKSEHERRVAKRKLEALGANLFDMVFPDALKVDLWDLWERIRTLQITSDEPWIPWEICRLKGRRDGRMEEGKFFAEAFDVTRWLYGVSAAPQLGLTNWALVVPGDSQLAHAPAEKEYVRSLAGVNRAITEVPATFLDVTDAMATGEYDAWHFSGHARASENTNADQSAIELQNRELLKPEDVAGRMENVFRKRPFVFLNACQSAQGGLSLTGIGGWAQRFLRPGSDDNSASAFIGSYWSVDDEVALAFARALYKGLLDERKPIGEAAKQARLSVQKSEDPTWLAYTVYADPNASVA